MGEAAGDELQLAERRDVRGHYCAREALKNTHITFLGTSAPPAQHLLPSPEEGGQRARLGEREDQPALATQQAGLPATQGGRSVEDRPCAARERTWWGRPKREITERESFC